MKTQPAAPPVVPPRPPIVAVGMCDPEDFAARCEEARRQLAESRRRIDEIIAANQAARARLDEWEAQLNRKRTHDV